MIFRRYPIIYQALSEPIEPVPEIGQSWHTDPLPVPPRRIPLSSTLFADEVEVVAGLDEPIEFLPLSMWERPRIIQIPDWKGEAHQIPIIESGWWTDPPPIVPPLAMRIYTDWSDIFPEEDIPLVDIAQWTDPSVIRRLLFLNQLSLDVDLHVDAVDQGDVLWDTLPPLVLRPGFFDSPSAFVPETFATIESGWDNGLPLYFPLLRLVPQSDTVYAVDVELGVVSGGVTPFMFPELGIGYVLGSLGISFSVTDRILRKYSVPFIVTAPLRGTFSLNFTGVAQVLKHLGVGFTKFGLHQGTTRLPLWLPQSEYANLVIARSGSEVHLLETRSKLSLSEAREWLDTVLAEVGLTLGEVRPEEVDKIVQLMVKGNSLFIRRKK